MKNLDEVTIELRSIRAELRQLHEKLTGSRAAFSAAEAASRLGVSLATVRRMIAHGDLATTTIGRRRLISASEVERLCRPVLVKRAKRTAAYDANAESARMLAMLKRR